MTDRPGAPETPSAGSSGTPHARGGSSTDPMDVFVPGALGGRTRRRAGRRRSPRSAARHGSPGWYPVDADGGIALLGRHQ